MILEIWDEWFDNVAASVEGGVGEEVAITGPSHLSTYIPAAGGTSFMQ